MKTTVCSVVLRIEPSFEDMQIISYVQSYDRDTIHHDLRIFTETKNAPGQHELQLLWERALSEKEVKRITTKLKRFTIKGPPQGSWRGYDGTHFQLQMTEGMNSIELKWWSHIPDEWKSVWKLVQAIQYPASFKTQPKWWQFWR